MIPTTDSSGSDRRDPISWVIATLMFAYLVLRVFMVPPVHDEVRMIRLYIDTGHYMPFHAVWDAGNHLLVTMLGHSATLLLGDDLWVLRLFPVLMYPVYAWAIVALTAQVNSKLLRWSFAGTLLTMPFLHEFFALFRGYGPALAFEALGVLWLIRFVQRGDRKSLLLALTFQALATFACLTLLVVLCCSTALVLFCVEVGRDGDRRFRLSATLLLGGGATALMALYGSELSRNNRLYWGGKEGFVKDTVGSLAEWVLGSTAFWVPYAIALLVSATLVWVLVRFIRKPMDRELVPLFVVAFLLIGEVAGKVFMARALGMPYPMERTALHIVPLFVLLMVYSLDQWKRKWPWIVSLGLVVLWAPVRTVASLNVDHTSLWIDQAIPEELFNVVAEQERQASRPLVIDGHYYASECWNYGRERRGEHPAPLEKELFPQPVCDLIILDTTAVVAPEGYHTLFVAPTGRMVLKALDHALKEEVIVDTTFSVPQGDREFVDLWKPSPIDSLFRRAYLVEIEAEVKAEREFPAFIISETAAHDDAHPYYDVLDFISLRSSWVHDSLHLVRRLPTLGPEIIRAAIYLHNPAKLVFELPRVRVRVHRVQP